MKKSPTFFHKISHREECRGLIRTYNLRHKSSVSYVLIKSEELCPGY